MEWTLTMRKMCVFALTCTAVLVSCHPQDRYSTCGLVGSATRVVVHGALQESDAPVNYVITDKQQIDQLIAFADARREVSQPAAYTMPAPQVSATFYRDADYVGSIGSGKNFFFISCASWKGIRSAAPDELQDFIRIIRAKK